MLIGFIGLINFKILPGNFLLIIHNSVFDGCSVGRSPQEALSNAFIETDVAFRRELNSQRQWRKGGGIDWHPGCTATTALLVHDTLYVANAGDCRTIVCKKGKAVPLSTVLTILRF